jgi:hypothetical protein
MPDESAPALTSSLPKFELPTSQADALVSQLNAGKQQADALVSQISSTISLRERCVGARVSVQSAVEQARGVQTEMDKTMAYWTEPTPAMVAYKDSVLEFRRKYKGPIVGGIAALSLVSAVGARGNFEKMRIAVRNLFIFGGSAAVLLYPEFAFRAGDAAADAAATGMAKVRKS